MIAGYMLVISTVLVPFSIASICAWIEIKTKVTEESRGFEK
jgi:hypothetical protein